VTSNQIELQLDQVGAIDAHVRHLPETGVDSVNRASLRNDLLYHAARSRHARACFRSENNVFPALSDVFDLLESELLAVEL
jgi:hypothetical protein